MRRKDVPRARNRSALAGRSGARVTEVSSAVRAPSGRRLGRLAPVELSLLVSKPTLNFPAEFVTYAASIAYSGTNIHGVDYPPFVNTPKSDAERY
jgi:hypothetical protein